MSDLKFPNLGLGFRLFTGVCRSFIGLQYSYTAGSVDSQLQLKFMMAFLSFDLNACKVKTYYDTFIIVIIIIIIIIIKTFKCGLKFS